MATRFHCALVVGLAFCGIVRAADTLQEVEKKIIAEADKIKTMSAKMLTTSETEATSMSTKIKMEGITETARRGEKMYMRAESKSTTVMKMSDQPENKTESKTLMVADGEFIYTLNEMDGNKTAMKMKQDPKANATTKDSFELMHKEYELKLLSDEKVDGKAVYVIEATPKKAEPDTTTTAKFYYTKEGGVMVKTVTNSKNPQMKMVMSFELTDVKINPDIKPERFVFKAPEGVEVQDMTKLATTQPQEVKPADEKPADDAKADKKDQKKDEKKPEPPPKEDKKPKLPKLPKLGK